MGLRLLFGCPMLVTALLRSCSVVPEEVVSILLPSARLFAQGAMDLKAWILLLVPVVNRDAAFFVSLLYERTCRNTGYKAHPGAWRR